jgi:hypothetical protein
MLEVRVILVLICSILEMDQILGAINPVTSAHSGAVYLKECNFTSKNNIAPAGIKRA